MSLPAIFKHIDVLCVAGLVSSPDKVFAVCTDPAVMQQRHGPVDGQWSAPEPGRQTFGLPPRCIRSAARAPSLSPAAIASTIMR